MQHFNCFTTSFQRSLKGSVCSIPYSFSLLSYLISSMVSLMNCFCLSSLHKYSFKSFSLLFLMVFICFCTLFTNWASLLFTDALPVEGLGAWPSPVTEIVSGPGLNKWQACSCVYDPFQQIPYRGKMTKGNNNNGWNKES